MSKCTCGREKKKGHPKCAVCAKESKKRKDGK